MMSLRDVTQHGRARRGLCPAPAGIVTSSLLAALAGVCLYPASTMAASSAPFSSQGALTGECCVVEFLLAGLGCVLAIHSFLMARWRLRTARTAYQKHGYRWNVVVLHGVIRNLLVTGFLGFGIPSVVSCCLLLWLGVALDPDTRWLSLVVPWVLTFTVLYLRALLRHARYSEATQRRQDRLRD
jgi:hypothetical protein